MQASGNTTSLTTADGKTIVLPSDAPGDNLAEYDIKPDDAITAIQRLYWLAFDDARESLERARPALDAISARPNPSTVLRNRIYRDRLDSPNPA